MKILNPLFIFLCLFCNIPTLLYAQCIAPTASNAILRQANLYQLIGNNGGAFDIPNGEQDMTGGNTLANGNWINRGSINLIKNGDFSSPVTMHVTSLANGTGGNGQHAVELFSLPNWLITGNSVNAYPFLGFNFSAPNYQAATDFGASAVNIYLGNYFSSFYTQQPTFENGYATNSNFVQPYITAAGISNGYGEANGIPIAIQQTVSTMPGSKYRLNFFVAGESFGFFYSWLMGLDITGYNRSILLVPGDTNHIRYEFEFTATSDSTTIRFVNWGHPAFNSSGTEYILDDVILNLVPDECVVLPITISMFQVSRFLNDVKVDWQTSFEQNNHHFELQNSSNTIEWETIGSVTSRGNGTTRQDYSFIHKAPKPGRNYYRVKQVDMDGKFSYSSIRSVLIPDNNKILVRSDSHSLHISATGEIKITRIQLYSMDAKMLFDINKYNGDFINIGQYPSSVYFLKLFDTNGIIYVKKIYKPG